MDPDLRADESAAIVKAVKTYYEGMNRSLSATDSGPFRSTFASNCEPCLKSADIIDVVADKGSKFVDAEYVVESIRVHDVGPTTAAAEVKYTVSSYSVFDSNGKLEVSFPAEPSRVDLSFVKWKGEWRLVNSFAMGA